MSNLSSFPLQLSKEQVWAAMNQLVDDIQTQWPDEEQAENVATFISQEFERNLLRQYVLPRVPSCAEIEWLEERGAQWIVKSSVGQFRDGLVRIHVNDKRQRARFQAWLESR